MIQSWPYVKFLIVSRGTWWSMFPMIRGTRNSAALIVDMKTRGNATDKQTCICSSALLCKAWGRASYGRFSMLRLDSGSAWPVQFPRAWRIWETAFAGINVKRGKQHFYCLPLYYFQSFKSSSNAWSIAAFKLFCMIARICCSRMLSRFFFFYPLLSRVLISSWSPFWYLHP